MWDSLATAGAAGAHIAAINAAARGQVTKVCSSRRLDAAELSARHGCAIQTFSEVDYFHGIGP